MHLAVNNTDNVIDDATLELDLPFGVATATIGATTFLFVSAAQDSGVSVFSVAADGTLTNEDNHGDDGIVTLAGSQGVATATIGSNTFLFATGAADNGVTAFFVSSLGSLIYANDVTDDATLELAGATAVTTATVGGTTYLFVAGFGDNGLSVFSVAADGTLTNVDNVDDDATLELLAPAGLTTATIGGLTYLFVAGRDDNGVSVFLVGADGTLFNVDNVGDSPARELEGAFAVTTAVIGDTTYLFVAGLSDNGVSVFRVAGDGTLTNVDNVADDATLLLEGPTGLATAVIGDTTYLFVTPQDGVSVFSVAADGTLTSVANIPDNATLVLNRPTGVTAALIGDTHHLFVAGSNDDGVSAFSLVPETIPPLDNVLWQHSDGTVATFGHELAAAPATFQIQETGDFDNDGDSDILLLSDDGRVRIWELQNRDTVPEHNQPDVTTRWQVGATGDFDGDGDSDILWRHDGGLAVIWEMEDNAFVTNHNLDDVSTTWDIAAAGDFDGDGDDDVLWRQDSGAITIWEMENGAFVTNHNLPTVSPNWQINGTGDFDNDGDHDILWRHNGGLVVIWEIEDSAYVVNHNLPTVSQAWQVAGTHDFNADGTHDLLWRHANGQVVTWEMQDSALVRTHNFGVTGNGWQIRGTGEFDLS